MTVACQCCVWIGDRVSDKQRGANMKQDDARVAVLGEYDGWAKDHPNDAKMMGGFVFFSYLQKEKPSLLDFRGASKWQIVHGWLRHGGRLEG